MSVTNDCSEGSQKAGEVKLFSNLLRGLIWFLSVMFLSVVAILAGEVRIDADIPAGNIVVEQIEGDRIRLHQAERDTPRFWFHWCFRVRGAQGRTLTFEFTKGHVFGTRGPAISSDGGQTWRWLGRKVVKGDTFTCTFPELQDEVRLAFAIPYTEQNLKAFLKPLQDHPALKMEELARTPHGRNIELLRAGAVNGSAKHRVLLTCRHHACESMANFVLEGVLSKTLDESATGRWLRAHVEISAVPFMDKDGVEEGDQGKLRTPHDHWLDYGEESRYVSVQKLKERFQESQKRPVTIAIDLHCPYLSDNKVFIALGSDPKIAAETERFSRLFEQSNHGTLVYRQSNNLPFNKGWNTPETYKGVRSFWQWAERLPEVKVVGTLEIPYASVEKEEVTPESARQLGQELAVAIERSFKSR